MPCTSTVVYFVNPPQTDSVFSDAPMTPTPGSTPLPPVFDETAVSIEPRPKMPSGGAMLMEEAYGAESRPASALSTSEVVVEQPQRSVPLIRCG